MTEPDVVPDYDDPGAQDVGACPGHEWKAEGLEVPEAYQDDARARMEGTLFFQARVLRIALIDLGEALWDTPPMRAVNALANWIAPPSVQEAADAVIAAIRAIFRR